MASARRKPNKFFFMFLLMLYPVLPLNYYIGSLSYANICGIMMVLAFFFFRLKKFDVRVFHEDWPFWQYLVVYALFTFATANALNGLAWVIADFFASVSIITSIETKEDFYQAIDGVILAGVLLGLLGIAESATGTYLIQGELMAKTDGGVGLRYGILRCTGPFGSPIDFGLYEAIAIILVKYRLSTDICGRSRKALTVAYIPLVVSMCLSVSRLAICICVAAYAILVLSSRDIRKPISVIAFLMLFGCVVVSISELLGIDLSTLTTALDDFGSSLAAMLTRQSQSATSGVVGFGNRFDLYSWVINYVGKDWLMGLGVKAEFSYALNEWTTKTSIEVNYLYVFFQCGVIGLASLLVFYIGNLRYAWYHRICHIGGEKCLTFANIALLIFALYYIALFGVQETDLARFHFELISLLIAYVMISRREQESGPFPKRQMDARNA